MKSLHAYYHVYLNLSFLIFDDTNLLNHAYLTCEIVILSMLQRSITIDSRQ